MVNSYRYFGGADCQHVGVCAAQVTCSYYCIYQLM